MKAKQSIDEMMRNMELASSPHPFGLSVPYGSYALLKYFRRSEMRGRSLAITYQSTVANDIWSQHILFHYMFHCIPHYAATYIGCAVKETKWLTISRDSIINSHYAGANRRVAPLLTYGY
jgi:hypothetical protein